jgi:hypothetical protein
VSNALSAHSGALIVGPKTRLGQALIERLPVGRTALVARSHDEHGALRARWPDRTTVERDGLADVIRPWHHLSIFACAIGAIHPGDPRPEGLAHVWETGARDLAIVRAAMIAANSKPVHVIFVSSVLALARARPERAVYTGWKLLVEGEFERLVTAQRDARLSVVYPGRLVEGPAGLASRLSTRYDRLAATLVAAASAPAGRRWIVGADARLWLLARGLAAGGTSISISPT